MSSSPTRGNRPWNPQLPWESNPSDLMLQGVLFYILFYLNFSFPTINSPVFNQTPKSKFNSPVLISLKSLVRRKPILVFDPRPLYCSSLTTAVGGTTDTNFVDSAHPTVARIKWRRCRGWFLSASEELWNTCDPHHKSW